MLAGLRPSKGEREGMAVEKFYVVTAPWLALLTELAYLAKTPRL